MRPDRLNLDHVPEIKEVRSFKQFIQRYKTPKLGVGFGNPSTECIFPIEVSKLSHQWTGDVSDIDSFNTLLNIPMEVIRLVQQGKCRIAIISIVEGDSYIGENWNSFKALHHDMEQRKLPNDSVIIVSGNLRLNEEYQQWCKNANVYPKLEIQGGIEWDAKTAYKEDDLVIDSVLRNWSDLAKFNSLNRTDRPHRRRHIDWLESQPRFTHDNLVSGYGYKVDVDNTVGGLGNVTNRDIYNASQLSVITETFFEEPGLFITEKTFRSIAIGHPCLVLGQHGILDYFDSIGINLRLPGLNTDYDSVQDPTVRFNLFHDTLQYWVHLEHTERYNLLKSWQPILKKNAQVYNSIDFKQEITRNIVRSTEKYFLTKP
jgi:hypothetical protein